ncbi:hypothetical protein BDD12DRAFT_879035 [Trichophaea hybrida]|nr:hypothetical protein BDD12DRAFT_879035 [Trichophaea hybrida]
MSRRADDSSSPAESVPPIVAVTVITVVVLIIFAIAVFMIIRAYKKRQRRGERRMSGWLETDFSDGALRGRGLESVTPPPRVVEMAKDTHQWRGENSAARNIRPPKPAARRTHRPRSWEPESSVGQELQRRVAGVKLGYEVSSPDAALSGVHTEEIALGMAPNMHRSTPSLSKLERMTGNQLSNDLYEGRTSRQGQSRDSNGLSIRNKDKNIFGYPKFNTNISYTPHQPGLNLYTDLSPSTTIGDFEFSPISPTSVGETTALAPPPPPPSPRPSVAQMAVAYPNIATLAHANRAASDVHPRRHSSRTSFSFREQGQNITEHIASQFNPAKRGRLRLAFSSGRQRSSTRSTRNLAPPLSAAFGGFTELDRHKTTRDSRASSISTFRFGTTVEDDPPPLPTPTAIERHSWSGRSVLFLDEASRWAGRGPRTPIRPVDEQMEGSPSLIRTLSASKASISSMISSVSSLNTLSGGFTGGLSPTPAPRPPRTADGTSANSQAPSVVLQEQQPLNTERIWEIADEESQERKKTPRSRDDEEDDDNDEHQPERSSFVFL